MTLSAGSPCLCVERWGDGNMLTQEVYALLGMGSKTPNYSPSPWLATLKTSNEHYTYFFVYGCGRMLTPQYASGSQVGSLRVGPEDLTRVASLGNRPPSLLSQLSCLQRVIFEGDIGTCASVRSVKVGLGFI